MAATGNVKISELTVHSNVDGREVMPISWEASNGSGYESYKMSAGDLKSYIGKSLGVTDDGANQGLNTKVANQAKEISYLRRDLGLYSPTLANNFCSTHSKNLSVETQNYAINTAGSKVSKSGYSVSAAVSVVAGTLYLLNLSSDIDSNVSIFSKKHVHTYYPITGYTEETVTDSEGHSVIVREPIYGAAVDDVTYEPLSNHYAEHMSQFHRPASNYVVFYAAEDEDIIISAKTSDISGKKLYAVHYALLAELSEKFIGASTGISRVIAEAIAALEGRVEALEGASGTIGETTAIQIDSLKMPKYRGGEMIVIADHAPDSVGTATKPADVPEFPGQMWIDTVQGKAWIAVSAGTFAGWKELPLS